MIRCLYIYLVNIFKANNSPEFADVFFSDDMSFIQTGRGLGVISYQLIIFCYGSFIDLLCGENTLHDNGRFVCTCFIGFFCFAVESENEYPAGEIYNGA